MAKRLPLNYVQYERDLRLVKGVEKNGFSRNRFEEMLSVKRELLRDFGYSSLIGEMGKPVDLEDCSPAKITGAVFNNYAAAKNRIKKYEEEVRASNSYRNLVELIEQERDLDGDKLEETKERTSIVMDSSPRSILYFLSRDYGREVMGGYFVEK